MSEAGSRGSVEARTLGDYLGVVIEQSVDIPAGALPVVGSRTGEEWTLLLVRVAEDGIDDHLRWVQAALVPGEPWYAHYWKGEELVVVFSDAIFAVTVDEASWDEPVEHGLHRGVPAEELDFEPRTVGNAEAFFGVTLR